MFGRKISLWKLKRSAKAGDPDSSFEVGSCYLNGIGTEKNVDKAVEFLKLGAEQGSAGAALTLGNMLERGYVNKANFVISDYNVAFMLFKVAADGGLAAGTHRMGMMYKDGRGTHQCIETAISMITDAAERGWNKARIDLYYLYRDGNCVEKDLEKALEYLKTAAEDGDNEAISLLKELHPEESSDSL